MDPSVKYFCPENELTKAKKNWATDCMMFL